MGTTERRRRTRRSLRLNEYDYSSAGAYFFTACVRGREVCLGEIADDEVRLWMEGQMIREVWDGLEDRFPGVSTDAFVVMPNHVHGVVVLESGAASRLLDPMVGKGAGVMDYAPTSVMPRAHAGSGPGSMLGEVVRVLKAVSTRRIREVGDLRFGWQRNYYERVIRNERELERARAYIAGNPARWAEDAENPRVRT